MGIKEAAVEGVEGTAGEIHLVRLTEGDAGAGGLVIDPEADPAEHDDENAGQIGLEDEVANVALQLEAEGEPLVDAGGELLLAVVRLVADYRELGQFGLVDAAHRGTLPRHHHVQHRVPVCRARPAATNKQSHFFVSIFMFYLYFLRFHQRG